MNKLVIYIIIILQIIYLHLPTFSQIINQPNRFEYELSRFEDPYNIISIGEKGLILFRLNKDKHPTHIKNYELIILDTMFQVVWEKSIIVRNQQTLLAIQTYKSEVFFLFTDYRGEDLNFQLISIDFEKESLLSKSIHNVLKMDFDGVAIGDRAAYIIGYYNQMPVVIHYSFETGISMILANIIKGNYEFVLYKIDLNGNFELILRGETEDKRKTLYIKTFNKDGNLIEDLELENDKKKNLIFGNTITSIDDENKIVAGTFGSRDLQITKGFFVSNIDQDWGGNLKYYNFSDLDRFFSYLKDKKESRIKARIEKRHSKGKSVDFNYNLMVNDMIPVDGGFILLGEAFFPIFKQDYTSDPSAAPYGVFNNTYGLEHRRERSRDNFLVESFQYTHACIIGFDFDGNIIWDNSFEINDVNSPVLDQLVFVSPEEDRIILLYIHNNIVRSKIIKENTILEGKSFDNLKLKFEQDFIRNTDLEIEALRPWYFRTFYAYGVQTIKHKGEEHLKSSRKVFFINKVVYR